MFGVVIGQIWYWSWLDGGSIVIQLSIVIFGQSFEVYRVTLLVSRLLLVLRCKAVSNAIGRGLSAQARHWLLLHLLEFWHTSLMVWVIVLLTSERVERDPCWLPWGKVAVAEWSWSLLCMLVWKTGANVELCHKLLVLFIKVAEDLSRGVRDFPGCHRL